LLACWHACSMLTLHANNFARGRTLSVQPQPPYHLQAFSSSKEANSTGQLDSSQLERRATRQANSTVANSTRQRDRPTGPANSTGRVSRSSWQTKLAGRVGRRSSRPMSSWPAELTDRVGRSSWPLVELAADAGGAAAPLNLHAGLSGSSALQTTSGTSNRRADQPKSVHC